MTFSPSFFLPKVAKKNPIYRSVSYRLLGELVLSLSVLESLPGKRKHIQARDEVVGWGRGGGLKGGMHGARREGDGRGAGSCTKEQCALRD